SGEYIPSGWQARVEGGHVQAGARRLLSFDARAGQASAPGAALVATSRFDGDLAGWLEQPIASAHQVVQQGVVTGEFIVALSERVELAAEFDLSNLVTTTGEVLPRVALEVRADRAEDGRIEAHLPLRVTQNGRASDLTVNAQARPEGD